MAIGALLFVGAFSYAMYSTFISRNNAVEIGELRQVNSIQQEQLLHLSRKANTLQDQIEQLAQMENELRRLSGLAPAEESSEDTVKDVTPDASGGGQGGPYVQPDVKNVGLALDNVEKQLQKGNFIDAIFDCPYELRELITNGFYSKQFDGLTPDQKFVAYFYFLRQWKTARIAAPPRHGYCQ